MKALTKGILSVALVAAISLPAFSVKQGIEEASAAYLTTPATGYTKAEDVDYEYSKDGKYLANWGAREETCTFLSPNAQDFYAQSSQYSYSSLSQKSGDTQSDAPKSDIYKALQSMMKAEHFYETSYDATKSLFCYTDCVGNNYAKISSFYSGKELTGKWDGTWNREHTWPNSKGNGNAENDIMMLRPTWVQENSSRGNTAYGQSSGYYDPNGEGANLRGDCARIVLYVYVRWGNTSNMWDRSGVMESLSVLLKWMQEDPVDTWEMGRNDAVESITGTRNVFVDYPEYAFLLFNQSIPSTMTTPSGIAKSGTTTGGGTTTPDGGNGGGTATPDPDEEQTPKDECEHSYGKWFVLKPATETEEGEQEHFCDKCGKSEKEVIPMLTPQASESTGSLLSGCSGSVYGAAGAIVLAFACVYVLKKRKFNQ